MVTEGRSPVAPGMGTGGGMTEGHRKTLGADGRVHCPAGGAESRVYTQCQDSVCTLDMRG